MKILIINGSPKGNKGNTHVIANELSNEAQSLGHNAKTIFLKDKNINHCLGCLKCWNETPGKCVQKDDMNDLLNFFKKEKEFDIIVYATPLYAYCMTGLMKNFIDRRLPLIYPHVENTPIPYNENSKQKILLISNCAFIEDKQFEALEFYFKKFVRDTNAEFIGKIFRTQGPLLTAPECSNTVESYKKNVREATNELLTIGKISKKNNLILNKLLMPEELYIKYFEALSIREQEIIQ